MTQDATPCGSHALVQGVVHTLVRPWDEPYVFLLIQIVESPILTASINNDMLIVSTLKGMPDGAHTKVDPADRVKNWGDDRNIHNCFEDKAESDFRRELEI
jgi:hypothetical protein